MNDNIQDKTEPSVLPTENPGQPLSDNDLSRSYYELTRKEKRKLYKEYNTVDPRSKIWIFFLVSSLTVLAVGIVLRIIDLWGIGEILFLIFYVIAFVVAGLNNIWISKRNKRFDVWLKNEKGIVKYYKKPLFVFVRKPTKTEFAEMRAMPVVRSKAGEFDCFYEVEETALIIEGEATVKYGERKVSLRAGDYVIFPKGLSCSWQIKKPVKKHYKYKLDQKIWDAETQEEQMEIIVRKPTEKEAAEMSGKPTWSCGVSEFDWYYDSEEHALLIAGEVTVKYGGKEVSFGAGDYVVFPRGLACVWQVKKPVRKYYEFK